MILFHYVKFYIYLQNYVKIIYKFQKLNITQNKLNKL